MNFAGIKKIGNLNAQCLVNTANVVRHLSQIVPISDRSSKRCEVWHCPNTLPTGQFHIVVKNPFFIACDCPFQKWVMFGVFEHQSIIVIDASPVFSNALQYSSNMWSM